MNDPHSDFYKIYDLGDEDLKRLIKLLPKEIIYRASVTMPKEFLQRLFPHIDDDLKGEIIKQQVDHEPFILVSDINSAQFRIGEIINNHFIHLSDKK
jgi:hypothetical protein